MAKKQAGIFVGSDSLLELKFHLSSSLYSNIFLLTDENTLAYCYPKLKSKLPKHDLICVKSGEEHKTLTNCAEIWSALTKKNADRNSLLINLGGGVVCDMGGFAATCYKRGIKFIHIPTTLLSMVDASVGGKTGVDFEGFKNQIGLFIKPEAVFISPDFLQTLGKRQVNAGMAEVIKHYLIADKKSFTALVNNFSKVSAKNELYTKTDWTSLIKKNIAIKSRLVAQDFHDNKKRRGLNFAHTIGHAVETYFLKNGEDILHGEAVAIGLIAESYISFSQGKISKKWLAEIVKIIDIIFPDLPILKVKQIKSVMQLIKQDKKNVSSKNQFTLLNGIGNFTVNNNVEEVIISESLLYYSKNIGIHS